MLYGRTIRFYMLKLGVCTVFFGLAFRLVELHLHADPEDRDKTTRKFTYKETLLSQRGKICDRMGKPVAMVELHKNIALDPNFLFTQSEDRDLWELQVASNARQLSKKLGVAPSVIEKALRQTERRYVNLKATLDLDTANKFAEYKPKHVIFEDKMVRTYPYGSRMCHVLGGVNSSQVGVSGVEMVYNSYLVGKDGFRESVKDGARKELVRHRIMDVPPEHGATIYLTLDSLLQVELEQLLLQSIHKFDAKGGWAAVMKCNTGEMLALASFPAFDANEYGEASPDAQRNGIVSMVYEPGSIMKPITIAAALNEGLITPDDVYDCEEGYWIFARRPLRDVHGYGELTVTELLMKSSNIGTAKIALELGSERLHQYLLRFGFGKKTGIDLNGEQWGIYRKEEILRPIGLTRIAIGHGISVTGIQMLNAINTIANGGVRVRPYVVQKIVNQDGLTVFENVPETKNRVLSERTSRIMRDLLHKVTTPEGTGRNAVVPGYQVAGKTGTAEKPSKTGGYDRSKNIGSFVGFLPADNPEVTILVSIDEPKKAQYGGTVAAPVFREIAERVVGYLGIPAQDLEAVEQLGFTMQKEGSTP